ncbi:DNA polymerase/3'-5' exonuclease PolX [Haloferax mediterranei ATCC 33500]|uniref:DNA-directed DNA polymerase n=1 Tax=Haloferax mediterranei (strain ATCC 33500 / DSM 1411 / JCM 8866 / NBRC 14739 / NCIMB 2177 / R-4) TaxID=523841 RepID=I3R2G3_HALMT|nr:DNA polymerase/3'-5' exonuclease PolX [Haloferax mediterranei]AFK18423.1 DNA polymerase IV [Haloferax mediterranei ATCC 33500]AHZ22186.1 DNA polymerase [Haloferax mediterranei ATCC 33500]EMA02301.1 DNA polymerase IV [Haloferax mediterranei ATCC 33500]MDX5988515.1 DNA polymerase/3'-5' exonuclease PolX [Haloferax mediterranei ATCC 33500]QCQ74931.1 DNA polymerase/3'-5' exonuclease PolX [Haloferax mediterranei ATCC 33500]
MSRNDEVATLLEEFADLLDAKDVAYKPSSYRRAAENVREHPQPIEELAAEGEDAVKGINRVGDAIASKIVEYIETDHIEELDGLRDELPVDMAGLTSVEGVGPKTVGTLYEELGITDLDELEAAARDGRIQEVKGFGAKTEANILDGIEFAREATGRELLGKARPVADDLLSYLADHDAVDSAEPAGSMRRWRETVGDIDVLIASDDAEAVIEHFLDWDLVGDTIEAGEQKASARVNAMRVDLRVVDPSEYGAALQYFTGSKDHNVHLRNIAIDRGLKMNEYGMFDIADVDDPEGGPRVGERVAGETEESMYGALDLPLIPPEMREDTGEIELAADGSLPDLIQEGEIRGDLHTHTNWSDGDNTIAEMVAAAEERGYDFHVVSDHATGPGMVGGVGVEDDELLEQIDEVRAVAEDTDITVFTGVEANIDAEGALSVDDDVLDQLDVVVASPHSALDQDRETATDRLVRAMEHPAVDILGHPTGRLINQRPGLPLDYERIASAAVENGVALELNASPYRLDLNGEALRIAVEAGATVAINTDAHRPTELDYARYGVHTARRGWVETADVLNTWSVEALTDFLH